MEHESLLAVCPLGANADDVIELLVDTSQYGVEGENWCPWVCTSPGTASVYPFKVRIPGRGIGQYHAAEVKEIRRAHAKA